MVVFQIHLQAQEEVGDGQTYFVVKVDDHNFKLANNYTLATNSTPSVITIGASGVGGNASDTFDPQKNLYISAGQTISGSQFSFPVDSINDDNAKLFGMQSTNVKTTITGLSVTTPTASNSTHFHIKIKDNSNAIGVFVKLIQKQLIPLVLGIIYNFNLSRTWF